jgi:hypothetical protein
MPATPARATTRSDHSLASLTRVSLLTALCVSGAAPQQGASTSERPATNASALRAPLGQWGARGGGPARSGASATPAPRGPVVDVWSVAFTGRVVGEPLVDGDTVLVVEQLAADEHRLHTLDRVTGVALGKPVSIKGVAPEPTLSRGLVVVRTGVEQIGFYRVGPRGLARSSSKVLAGPVTDLLLVDEGVLATVAGQLVLLSRARGAGRTVWTSPARPVGRVAANDECVYVPVAEDGTFGVAEVALADGRVRHTVGVALKSDPASGLGVSLVPGAVAVTADRALPWRPGQPPSGTALPLPLPYAGEYTFPTALHNIHATPTAVRDGYVCRPYDVDSVAVLVHVEHAKSDAAMILASPLDHAAVLDLPRATYADGLLLIGGSAVDLTTNRFVWKTAHTPIQPPVPARGRVLLVVDGGQRVVAVGDAVRRAPVPFASIAPDIEVEATVATARGELEASRVILTADGPRRAGVKEARAAIDGALALCGADGALLWAAGGEAAARASQLVSARELGAALAELAGEARKAGDPDLLGDLIDGALAMGIEERALAGAQKTLESISDSNRKPKPERVTELRAAEAALRTCTTDVAWRWASDLLERGASEHFEVTAALLEEVLEREPAHAGAIEAVRRLLPTGIEPKQPFAAREWLTFLRTTHRTPVTIVRALERETADMTYAENQLGRARHTWRKDLIAFETEHLLVLSTPDRPGALARCISLASLTCEALTELFAEHGRETRLERKLVVRLYPTRDEYLAESEKQGVPPGAIAWTGGFYSPVDNMSRLFIPEEDSDLGDTLRTITHETTHHWLDQRCPMWSREDLQGRSPLKSGYWIVEGFAGFVEEWLFDTSSSTWDALNPRSERLDIVAHTRDGARLPWKDVYALSQMAFHTGEFKGEAPTASAWMLGARRVIDARQMYYCQAAATCAYLFHADEGKHRKALLEYLRAYYTGKGERNVSKAFGVSHEALGERVQAFAHGLGAR